MTNKSQVMGYTKKLTIENKKNKNTSSNIGVTKNHPGDRPGWPGSVQNGNVAFQQVHHRQRGPLANVIWFEWQLGPSNLTSQSLDQMSDYRDMECHFVAGGRDPELLWEVERHWPEKVGLTSTHSSGSRLLERGWTIPIFLGCPEGVEVVWCGLRYSFPTQPPCLEVHPGEQDCCFPPPLGIGLLLFVSMGQTAVESTWPSQSPWEGNLIMLCLGSPLFYWGTSKQSVRVGSEDPLHDLNQNGVLLLDFSAHHSLSMT